MSYNICLSLRNKTSDVEENWGYREAFYKAMQTWEKYKHYILFLLTQYFVDIFPK